MHELSPAALASLPDEALLEALQRRTFRFFWEGAEPESGLARDRNRESADAEDHLVAVGGSGFGIMAMIVAVSRGWITRDAAVARLERMLAALERAERHHGVFPHFLDGVTGATIPFGPQDDGGDLVETSFLIMGLLTARSWLDQPADAGLRARITALWESVEWDWHVQPGQAVLTWHWSPRHGFAMNHAIRGWNECLITYVLAAASSTHGIGREIYEQGFCQGPDYRNGNSYYGIRLPLGPALGGPLFFTHYSFCGLNPHGLRDAHAD
ncbi:MAG TPA: glucoamylase family protein, partial [Rhizomicrobium sp.]|nr:glucoamylase family protein [Rhizomicrobium sp.]